MHRASDISFILCVTSGSVPLTNLLLVSQRPDDTGRIGCWKVTPGAQGLVHSLVVFRSAIYAIGPCWKPDGLLAHPRSIISCFPPLWKSVHLAFCSSLLRRPRTAGTLPGLLVPLAPKEMKLQRPRWGLDGQLCRGLPLPGWWPGGSWQDARAHLKHPEFSQNSPKETQTNLGLALPSILAWVHRWGQFWCAAFKECAQARTGIWSINFPHSQVLPTPLCARFPWCFKPPFLLPLVLPCHSNTPFCVL